MVVAGRTLVAAYRQRYIAARCPAVLLGRRFGNAAPTDQQAKQRVTFARHLQAAGSYWAADRDGYSFLGEQVRTRLLADIEARQCHYPDRAAQLATWQAAAA